MVLLSSLTSTSTRSSRRRICGVTVAIMILAFCSRSSRQFGVRAFSVVSQSGGRQSVRSLATTATSSRQSNYHRLFSTAKAPESSTTTTDTAAEAPAAITFEIPKKFVPYPFDYHTELTLTIDTLTNLGMGIARVKLSDAIDMEPETNNDEATEEKKEDISWVIMIPNVIPGEVVTGRIFRNHKSYSEADLIKVIEASPDRVIPKCPLAEECGGCQYQHMPVTLQREWKTKHVVEMFTQQKINLQEDHNKIEIQPATGTEHEYNYRSKITPHYQAPSGNRSRRRNRQRAQERKEAYVESGEPLPSVKAIGFQRSTVRSILDVPSCPIAMEPLNVAYIKKREELLGNPYQGDLGATLLFRQGNLNNETVVSDHNEYMVTTVNGIDFTYLAGNFFQNNLYIIPGMVDTVMEKASPSYQNSDNEEVKMTHFVDCYCGSGLFCLSAAQHFEICVGIEINKKAIEEAKQNAIANDLSHKCTFEASRAEAIFDNPNVQTFPRSTTTVMLDPPRKGCDETFLKQLERFRPRRIVYLSCNPATQARDVKEMVSWGYTITFVQPFDLFPQTRHIESLAVLERPE